MSNQTDFTKFLPGFDFLQGLLKNASSSLPSMSQWVAPTLDPQELDKRIEQLRTVHFWLEQNARMIAATIQALEVQRMTLNTLQTMNVQISDLGEALKMKTPWSDEASADKPARSQAEPSPAAAAAPATQGGESASSSASERAGKAASPGHKKAGAAGASSVDPMQWWGALTQQFGELAARTLAEGADAAQGLRAAATKVASSGAAASKSGASSRGAKGAKGASKGSSKGAGKSRGRTSTRAGAAKPKDSSGQEP